MHSSRMYTGRFSGRLLSAGVGGYVSALWGGVCQWGVGHYRDPVDPEANTTIPL